MAHFENYLEPLDLEKVWRETDRELIKKARLPKDLLVEVEALVTYVEGYTKEERGYLVYTSHKCNQNISVTRLRESISPIERIIFNGNSPVVGGDVIKVGIFIGKRENLMTYNEDKRVVREDKGIGLVSHSVFLPRDFNKEEEALYIKILRDGKEVRTDFGVNYKK